MFKNILLWILGIIAFILIVTSIFAITSVILKSDLGGLIATILIILGLYQMFIHRFNADS